MEIPGVGGIQSYAYGQHDGKWLIVGGRLDGLHKRRPFESFDLAGHNTQLIIIDPQTKKYWTATLENYPNRVQEQLRSTNMEFYQQDAYLYLIGGYGYSDFNEDHVTFPHLTVIDVPAIMNAMLQNENISGHVRQYTHDTFAVTGGQLMRIYDTYHLVGGQKFTGRYNPMGPTHGPGFIQEYTEEIRRFKITDDGTNLSVQILPTLYDSDQLHRRDFNVVPQILPNGQEGLTAFSGVFQKIADVPYLNSLNIDSTGYSINTNFLQYYNHYHCATLPIYDGSTGDMHTIFFGGIAQYYEEGGILVQDDEVPFVKTIARVTRQSDGTMAEYKLPISMPDYLGASAEFIPIEDVPYLSNGVLDLNALPDDSVLIGYIYGGIHSSAKNVFWINDGNQSMASPVIYKVYLTPGEFSDNDVVNSQSQANLQMQLYPIPNNGMIYLDFWTTYKSQMEWTIYNMSGKVLAKQVFPASEINIGKNHRKITLPAIHYGNVVLVKLNSDREQVIQKLVINEL
jgi:hypothetical protein